MAETDETVLARLTELAKSGPCKESGLSQTGAMKWVRRFFPQITAWREEGWTFEQIAELFNQAAVPLSDARWSPKTLRTLYARERRRRDQVSAERREAVGADAGASTTHLADAAWWGIEGGGA
jgi:hypothetical protein